MESVETEEDESVDLSGPLFFPASVQAAISEVFAYDEDPLDAAEFSAIDYINEMFPTEQSLTNLDDCISDMRGKITSIDDDLRQIVRVGNRQTDGGSRTNNGVEDASLALAEAQSSIVDLFSQIRDIKTKAAESEATVRDITRDIKQLDVAKRNLTTAITTLNHLHLLVDGVNTLKKQKEERQYQDAAHLLQGLNQVIIHFNSYSDIPQVKDLSTQLTNIQDELGDQIINDFHKAFAPQNAKNFVGNKQLSEACKVVSVLDPKVKKSLLKFILSRQLAEYSIVFSEGEECAWINRIDDRYKWLTSHLVEFEERLDSMFPKDWEMSERIAVEFCQITRKDLEKTMFKRQREIDTKLLLHAVQRTSIFESQLSRRFTGLTMTNAGNDHEIEKEASKNPFEEPEQLEESNPFFEDGKEATASPKRPEPILDLTPFHGVISKAFEPYLHIYIESQDANLVELIDRAAMEQKKKGFTNLAVEGSSVLHSCGDLFMFYKKCMVQCAQLSTGEPMLALTNVFKKHLKEYASRLLLANLPKLSNQPQSFSSMTSTLINRDIKELTSQLQNFHTLLKEGEQVRPLHADEKVFICSVIVTAEYIIETTQQLESKLKEKVDKAELVERISLAEEQDMYHGVISTCLGLLVQELDASCDPALTAMTKMPWATIESVGDQSAYVTSIVNHMKQTIPLIRDNLVNSKKYFTQFCIKFANAFIPKFVSNLSRCRPLSTVGAEQLLLDTHSIKTLLLDLPTVGSKVVSRKAPASYTKIVIKQMTRAEMTLKVVMSPSEPINAFVDQFIKLLSDANSTEFIQVLDMKGIRKVDQGPYLEQFNNLQPNNLSVAATTSLQNSPAKNATSGNGNEGEESRIKKLEKMIRKKL